MTNKTIAWSGKHMTDIVSDFVLIILNYNRNIDDFIEDSFHSYLNYEIEVLRQLLKYGIVINLITENTVIKLVNGKLEINY